MSGVAIVILNYNGQRFIEQFLPTVINCSSGHDIYVADNASTDDSAAWIEENYPSVKIIKIAHNQGFAGGYNTALAQVEAEFYVLLNSDVLVTPRWVEPMLALFQNYKIAACQPKIKAHHSQNQFEYAGAAGGYLDWLGYAFCRGRIFETTEIDVGQYNDSKPIFWATGACMMIRANVFHELGGFDDSFFAHMEEIDLCWRLHLAGYEVFYTSTSTVYHVGGGTLPSTSPYKTYLNYRNNLAMLYKNLPASKLLPIIFLRVILDGISVARFLPKLEFKNILAVIHAHFAFYGMIPQLSKKRKAIQQNVKRVDLYPKSIIWQYFIKKKKKFSEL